MSISTLLFLLSLNFQCVDVDIGLKVRAHAADEHGVRPAT